MLTKRIIPCLDIKGGRTVKGINFKNLVDSGDPIEQSISYSEQGADELVFLDISATEEERKTLTSIVKQIGREINIPFTVGGGISSVKTVSELLASGADKISLNSSAVRTPKLIDDLAKEFGSQCVVIAIDADKDGAVYTHGGKKQTGKELFSWAKEVQERGAGEILYTAMHHDGTKSGFDIESHKRLHSLLQIPCIASGGAGKFTHFVEIFPYCEAALAASIFHFGEIHLPKLKKMLQDKGVSVRIEA